MTVLHRGRRMRGAWLTSTAIAYALLTAGATWLPNSGSIDAERVFSVLPFTAPIATGLLIVWVGITGGLGVLGLTARRLRPASHAGAMRVPS